MAANEVPGGAYAPNQQRPYETSTDHVMSSFEDVLYCLAAVTVTLPPTPKPAVRHRIAATNGDVIVSGGAHALLSGAMVVDGSEAEYEFTSANAWAQIGGGSGSAGPTGPTGTAGPTGTSLTGPTGATSTVTGPTGATGTGVPASPDRSLQFDDGGVFGASTWQDLDPNVIHATEDESAITQHDATTDTDFTVYQHLYTPESDPSFPPGVSMVLGSDSVGTLASLPDVTYFACKFWHTKYCDDGDGTNAQHTIFGLGGRPRGSATPLAVSGNYFFPNTMLDGFFIDPADDLFGGGTGVEFVGVARVAPTTAPTSRLGIIRYVREADSKPYALNDQADIFPMFAVATMMWGNGSVGADDTTVYLSPAYDPGAAITDVADVAYVRLPTIGKLHGIAVSQTVDTEAEGTLTYTVFTEEFGDTGISIDVDANDSKQASATVSQPYVAQSGLGIRIDKTPDVNTLPTNVVVTLYFEQQITA